MILVKKNSPTGIESDWAVLVYSPEAGFYFTSSKTKKPYL